MKFYSSLNVNTRLQTNGSTWVLVFDGPTEEIEQTFNGLFNLKGVGKRTKLEYTNDSKTMAYCWSSPARLALFFKNQYELKHMMHRGRSKFSYYYNPIKKVVFAEFFPNKQLEEASSLFALNCLEQLTADTVSFTPIGRQDFNACWGADENSLVVLTNKAERPDHDFFDKVLGHAYRDTTDFKENEKALGCKDL